MPTMIPFHEALARAIQNIIDQPIEFCRGSVESVHRQLDTNGANLPDFNQPVPEEIIPSLTRQLREGRESAPRISPGESARRRSLAASYGLARMAESAYVTDLALTREQTRRVLYEHACANYPISYALNRDEESVVDSAIETAKKTGNVALQLLLESDQAHFFFACARWADQAFPLIQLAGHRYAAALMSTTVSESVDVRPPWKAFLIEVPDGLVTVEATDGSLRDVTYVLVHVHDGYEGTTGERETLWTILAFSGTMIVHRYNQTFKQLVHGDCGGESEYAFDIPLGSHDERALLIITRLVLSVCVAMSDPDRIKLIGKHRKGWTQGPGRGSKEPELRTFRVGKPIELDCRPEIESYLAGHRRGPLTVQFLVRGHFREQACGPRHSLRKTIWIHPHWKGPEDSPIVVRPHVLQPEDP